MTLMNVSMHLTFLIQLVLLQIHWFLRIGLLEILVHHWVLKILAGTIVLLVV
jgi:hypothetical protein